MNERVPQTSQSDITCFVLSEYGRMDPLAIAGLAMACRDRLEKTFRLTGEKPEQFFEVHVSAGEGKPVHTLNARFHESPPQVVIMTSGDGETEHWVPLCEAPYVLAKGDAELRSTLRLADERANRADAIRGVVPKQEDNGGATNDFEQKIRAVVSACQKISNLLHNTIGQIRYTFASASHKAVSFYVDAINPMWPESVDPEVFLTNLNSCFRSLIEADCKSNIDHLQHGGVKLAFSYVIPGDYAFELLRKVGVDLMHVKYGKEAKVNFTITIPANISQPRRTYYVDSGSFVFEVTMA